MGSCFWMSLTKRSIQYTAIGARGGSPQLSDLILILNFLRGSLQASLHILVMCCDFINGLVHEIFSLCPRLAQYFCINEPDENYYYLLERFCWVLKPLLSTYNELLAQLLITV